MTPYKPIRTHEYRVLHLLPGSFNDEIRCVLETRSSDVKTHYEALSYQWGDATITKPIHVARLDPPPPRVASLTNVTTRWPVPSFLRDAVRLVQVLTARFDKTFRFLQWSIGTFLLWSALSRMPLVQPNWVPQFISRDAYFLLLCMICGSAPWRYTVGIFELLFEIHKTRPWSLAIRFRPENHGPFRFETTQVTTNLELALRYLRPEKSARTLWVDSLCINQEDEEEKKTQIQRMDWIYANASPVVVWLGGYHAVENTSGCNEGGDCEHRRQIRAAFKLIWSRSGWRFLVPFYFSRGRDKRFEAGRPGLIDIQKRGWWERLWVIQEVALATATVKLQCGDEFCDLEEFWSAQFEILLDHQEDQELTRTGAPAKHLGDVSKEFHFDDSENESETRRLIAKGIFIGMVELTGVFGIDVHDNKLDPQDQSFQSRLQTVLLRTAGRFKCSDDQDRLYAVLGIAEGVKSGYNTRTPSLVRLLSSQSTGVAISTAIQPYYEAGLVSSSTLTLMGLLAGAWGVYYDAYAKYWAINRPGYVVKRNNNDILDQVKRNLGRTEFFTALARYLGGATGTLSFLDAANTVENEGSGIPSWVPNWTREVDEAAFNFSIRRNRDNDAVDVFGFLDNGTVLELLGRPIGTVHVVRSPSSSSTWATGPYMHLYERWLVLEPDIRKAVISALRVFLRLKTIIRLSKELGEHALDDELEEPLSELSKMLKMTYERSSKSLLEAKTLVYSLDGRAREMGFLKAGKAARGDMIVFVPGCYHYLILRKQEAVDRWKLAGLVSMGTPKARYTACTRSEWEQYRKDGAVYKYAII